MARTLSIPKNLELFRGVITALNLRSGRRAPQNDEERMLLQTMISHQVKPEVALRMVGTFDAVPHAERRRLHVSRADAPFSRPLLTQVDSSVRRVRERVERLRDHRFPGLPGHLGGFGHASGPTSVPSTIGERPTTVDRWPDRDPSILYTIRYVGLFCQDETGITNVGSDEIYVLSSAIHISNGQNVTTDAIRNPANYPDGKYYGDVDTGDSRVGPVTAVWSGNPDTVSLVVVTMEHDQGDPDAYREEIDAAVKAALAVATYFYPPAAVVALVEEQIVDLINWLFGSGDDIISTETVVLERAQLEGYAQQGRSYYVGKKDGNPLPTQLFQHFVTTHRGDHTEYVIGFDVLRDPPLAIEPVIIL